MATHDTQLPPLFQAVVDRFVAACQADDRIVAAFLGGSYARRGADALSDLDLYLIATDRAFPAVVAEREALVRRLGEPLFLESFDLPGMVFFILSDGAEGELGLGSESNYTQIHRGPYQVLVDKKGLLSGAVLSGREPDAAAQTETLRRLLYWFWHDMSHFITALGRGQLWWAQGQLETLRGICVKLARLRHNFLDAEAGDEAYFKVEQALPAEALAPLQATVGALEANGLLASGFALIRFYKALAEPLAQAHGLPYPAALEGLMVARLEELRPQK